jgi:hypothetical protein
MGESLPEHTFTPDLMNVNYFPLAYCLILESYLSLLPHYSAYSMHDPTVINRSIPSIDRSRSSVLTPINPSAATRTSAAATFPLTRS